MNPTNSTSFYDLNSLNSLREHNGKTEREALKIATKEFEAYFINLMLKNMRSANELISDESNPLTGDKVSFFNEMHDQQLAINMARSSNFGIGAALYRQLSESLPNEPAEKSEPANISPLNPLQRSAVINNKNTNSQSTSIIEQDNQINSTSDTRAMNHVMFGSARSGVNINYQSESDQKRTNQDVSESSSNQSAINQTDFNFNSKSDFIDTVKPYAIEAAKALGVHPGVLIAQAALETGWGRFFGKNEAGQPSMNLFGIKADNRWQGDSIKTMTIEFNQGIPEKVRQKFRAYDSLKESFNDYVKFVKENPRYQSAIENVKDPKAYLEKLHQGGYATDPQYVDKIHSIFVREALFKLTD
ncbi:flagellar assembly peptidoglycan hydrolase FlgJ [Pleionea sediminis]|uniref:flagellar assembly peptidoglycan hydrolase FlgJ n=1 Tax=Pleionea sediminis TaxID=2569479 RepID=UPI0011847A65|nr:flagellar assembly peptidoglycan hydrolase FlgJ [Pleionea sediminis]